MRDPGLKIERVQDLRTNIQRREFWINARERKHISLFSIASRDALKPDRYFGLIDANSEWRFNAIVIRFNGASNFAISQRFDYLFSIRSELIGITSNDLTKLHVFEFYTILTKNRRRTCFQRRFRSSTGNAYGNVVVVVVWFRRTEGRISSPGILLFSPGKGCRVVLLLYAQFSFRRKAN